MSHNRKCIVVLELSGEGDGVIDVSHVLQVDSEVGVHWVVGVAGYGVLLHVVSGDILYQYALPLRGYDPDAVIVDMETLILVVVKGDVLR